MSESEAKEKRLFLLNVSTTFSETTELEPAMVAEEEEVEAEVKEGEERSLAPNEEDLFWADLSSVWKVPT
jgi:hypothetical protein